MAAGWLCGFQPPVGHQTFLQPTPRSHPGDVDLVERGGEAFPHQFATEHFVVRWGDLLSLPSGFEQQVVEDLEFAWSVQVDQLGWEHPQGTDQFKVDVYVGNSDPLAPTIDFAGAYVTLRLGGDPYIVISPELLNSDVPYEDVLAHEFNHTLQLGSSIYDGPRGAFYYEATANHMAAVTNENPSEYRSWGPYLLHPELSVYSFSAIDDFSEPGRIQRQYSTAMFVQYLADSQGSDFVRRSWDDAVTNLQPLAWFNEEIEGGIRPVFVDFAVSHAVGDHARAEPYFAGADNAVFQNGRASITAWLPADGGGGAPLLEELPEAYAWNHIVWNSTKEQEIVFRFTPGEGDQGNASGFVNTAVIERERAFLYTPFDTEVVLDVLPGDFVHFVLVSVPESSRDRERFSYSYQLDVGEAEAEKGGCGCNAGSSIAWGLWALVPFLFRRRGGRS